MSTELIDETTLSEILAAIRQGTDLQSAVMASGFNLGAFLRLLEVGHGAYERQAQGARVYAKTREHLRVYTETQKARAEAAQALQRRVMESEDWKASKWMLENNHPELIRDPGSGAVLPFSQVMNTGGDLFDY